MDRFNNAQGRSCGVNDPRDCTTSCLDKLANGQLGGLGGTQMAPTLTPNTPVNPGPIYY